jgi:hypothetical protein
LDGALAWPGSGLDDADELRAALLEEGQRLGEGLSDASGGVDLYGDLQLGGTPASAELPLPAERNALPVAQVTQPGKTGAVAADPAALATQPAEDFAPAVQGCETQSAAAQPAAEAVGLSSSGRAAGDASSGAAPEPEPVSASAPASGAAGRAARAAARADAFRAPSDAGREDELSASESEGGGDDDGEEDDDELVQARREEERRRAVR